MTPPDEILLSQIELGERGRSIYSGIERLADLIQDGGLIQPIVLVPLTQVINQQEVLRFGLDAGGRRFHALKLLGHEKVYHAATCDPARPGFVLKGEQFVTPFQRLMTEIAENLAREEMPWQDQIKLIVKAWREAQREKHAEGEKILMRDFGAMLGVGYGDLQAANAVHDDLILNPERYKDCTGIRNAYTKLLRSNEVELTKILAAKSIQASPLPLSPVIEGSSVEVQSEPEPLAERPPVVIPLTSAFKNCNSLDYMESLTEPTFDHIITDPDYGVSVERLEANMQGASVGVAQDSVTSSLLDMDRFITVAWRVIRDQGFLVFWYDLDHHEKLQRAATKVGFAVQRWPLIWVKSDYRSNAAPAYNFTKNIEYAMVCRKPNAVLAQAQNSSVFMHGSGQTTRDFNHPFAKPVDLWKWIMSAVAIKGQVVFDPFAGAGSSCVAATNFGLKSAGCELNPDHYSNLLLNMQVELRKLLGKDVTFS